MADREIRCVLSAEARNGESPVWCASEQRLYWIDSQAPALHRFDPATGENESWAMPSVLGCAVPGGGGRVLLALTEGIARFDTRSGALELLAEVPFDPAQFVANDGKCDPQGRLWFGAMQLAFAEPGARGFPLLRHHPAQVACDAMTPPVRISNGLAWSPDGGTMYHADTPQHTIFAHDFDAADGSLGPQRIFARVEAPASGGPDGAAVDEEGGYWSAVYGAGQLVRFDPQGKIEREIRLPVLNPTMCAFGGADLRTMYVTSARESAPNEAAGGLLALEVPFTGLPAARPHADYFTMPALRTKLVRA